MFDCKNKIGKICTVIEIVIVIVSAKIPATLEPSNLCRSDGKRPDGLTNLCWKQGKPLIWDFTVADTLCDTYVKKSAKQAGSAAETREELKTKKYKDLTNYHFVPIAAETYGAWGPQGLRLLKEIGSKICDVTNEKCSTFYLLQRLSIAIQRGNAACILGSVPESESLDEVFDFVEHSSES